MYAKYKELIIAFILGFVIPSTIFALPNKWEQNQTADQIMPTQIENTDRIYRIPVLHNGQVVSMELETYILGVVLREMPADFESEALKAQAVVARTYALRKYENGGKHDIAVICTDSSCCQGYRSEAEFLSDGGTTDLLNKVCDAVSATKGQVLRYDNKLIDATYFSCSGGMTEDAQSVWGTDVPYLQATQSPGEESAAHFVDTKTFSVKKFASLLNLTIKNTATNMVESVTYTSGGGVENIVICGKRYKGTELRKKLGLRSTVFAINVAGDTVTITTKGYGHRVGMSQYGADAMAVNGKSYDEILMYYYKGTILTDYADN